MVDRAPGDTQGLGFPRGGVFKASLDAVVVMAADGFVIDWNPAAEELFGYSHQQAVGRELAGLIVPPALRERHRSALSRYTKTRKATILGRRLEMRALRGDGTVVPVELTITEMEGSAPPIFAGFIRPLPGGGDGREPARKG